jgi:hypothetical protein
MEEELYKNICVYKPLFLKEIVHLLYFPRPYIVLGKIQSHTNISISKYTTNGFV